MKFPQLLVSNPIFKNEKGFSLTELLIVVVVSTIITGVAFLSYKSPKKFAADDQALKILDIFQEARQRAINQRTVIRVEINNTKKQITLIDENETQASKPSLTSDSADDVVIKNSTFDTTNTIVGVHPSNVSLTNVPVQTTAIPEISFSTSMYSLSSGNSVYTMCFLRDGSITQSLSSGLCPSTNSATGAVIRGTTIYVYSIPETATNKAMVIRAVTVSGVSAAARLYKCQLDSSNNCNKWN